MAQQYALIHGTQVRAVVSIPDNVDPSSVVPGAPETLIPITDDSLAPGPYWTYDGIKFSPPTWTPELVVEVHHLIDTAAERTRQHAKTAGVQQQVVYELKYLEAVRYLATTPEPVVLDGFPFIQAEVEATGATPHAVASTFSSHHTAWVLQCAEIERIRISAKVQILNETTVEGVAAVLDRTYRKFDELV